MKYIKEYNEYVDPFNEDDWDEVEIGSFLTWLKNKYPDENTWKDIKIVYCDYNNLTDLIGIEKLINLMFLNCQYNRLTKLDVSKNINLRELSCSYNQLRELDTSRNINLSHYHQLDNHNQNLKI